MAKHKLWIAALLIAGWNLGCDDASSTASGSHPGDDSCQCTDSQVCVEDVCYDPKDLCNGIKCADSQECVDNVCTDSPGEPEPGDPEDKCGEQTCDETETCLNDSCVPKDKVCGNTVCLDIELCHNDSCVPKDKMCNAVVCKEDELCQTEICVPKDKVCGSQVCTDTQSCRDNQCVEQEKLCGTEVCTDAQICVTGQCIDNTRICGDAVCSASQVCHDGTCVAAAHICGESVCKDQQICVNDACQDPAPAQIQAVLEAAPVVSESGSSVQVSVSLTTQPTADVRLSILSDNTKELTVSPATMTFTPENWETPQVIEATGVDDPLIDGSVKSNIIIASASEDTAYAGLSRQIAITTEDDDEAKLLVTSTGMSLAENGDETAQFTVVLSAQPTAEVVISLASSDTSELTILGSDKLIFTGDQWNTPQTVTLKPEDDSVADGIQPVFIKLTSESEDANFNLLEAETENYNITDDETPGVVITPSATTLTPDAAQIEVTISLTAPPVADVVVSLATTNETTAALAETTFTFTPDNWNEGQKVTVSNTDPMSAAAALTTETLSAIAMGEGAYENIKSNEIALKIYAMTSIELEKARTCEMQRVTLLPGKYKLEAWGAQGGLDGPGNGPIHVGGKGGYATGVIELSEKKDIYVMVGAFSLDFNNYPGFVPCNGGGINSGSSTGAGGGGATHIAATELGELPNYEDSKSDVYLVAGGGGGAGDYAEGGAGGGETGGNGVGSNSGAGATQTTGFKFGQGEPASGQNPGGGGGWFGGKRSNGGVNAGGGGGSGYIGGVLNGEMTAGVQDGDGKAKITVIDN